MSDDIEHLKVNKIVRREGDRVGLEVYGRLAPAPPVTEAVGGDGQEPAGPVDREALRERIVETLKSIFDPEIPVNIYDLGLIYGFEVAEDGSVGDRDDPHRPRLPGRRHDRRGGRAEDRRHRGRARRAREAHLGSAVDPGAHERRGDARARAPVTREAGG
ncbi:MAG: hypothetical protein M5U28_26075 [Sandaracinaceae bacterium]|nr:hypothetical protein [Sandaracinaceae bacterium]